MRILATLTVVLVLAACGSDSPAGVETDGKDTFTAKVEGRTWSANFVQAQYINSLLAISGSDGDTNLALFVPATGTGTYDLTDEDAQALLFDGGSNWSANGVGGSGSITITSLSASGAKGTFSFTGGALPNTGTTGTRAVTQGTFNVTF